MTTAQIESFKDIWLKSIVGIGFDSNNQDFKTFLYESLISRNDDILELLGLKISNVEGIDLLQHLVSDFSKVESNPLGFFPVGILKTRKLTCAGNTMLANKVLKDRGYNVSYARPSGHSVNLVLYDNKYYWVDATNNVLDLIDVAIEKKDTFSIAHINTTNEKIIYKLAPIFKPQDIILNIFGNIEALKARSSDDLQVKQFLDDNNVVYKFDFNSVKECLYKEYFDYVRYDPSFQEEQVRVERLTAKA